ncbi:hypothetical protein GF319_08300 [Candidatus Bathyarchaeota archaeon]|nr:hypothetical protein [Candidatus Bathyarchaeota archaeon]
MPELNEEKDNFIKIDLDKSLRRYLNYLKKIKNIKDEEEAIESALQIYKKLNMHEWMPYIYRSGNERLLIISHGMFNDILSTIPESRLFDLAKSIALKRKVLRTFDPNLDLTQVDNWSIILNEMENLGWGKFTRDGDEIKIEYPGIPLVFIRGYLEALFNQEFCAHVTMDGKIMVLRPQKS